MVKRDDGQSGGLYLEECNIGFSSCPDDNRIQHLPFADGLTICADNDGIKRLRLCRGRQAICRVVRSWRQQHAYATRIPYYMLIGNDVTRRIDDDAGADNPTRCKRAGIFTCR
jgi:hypothetical protein